MTAAATLRFTFLGVTGAVTTCDCCGRQGLAKTIALRENSTEEILYFGSACGAKAIGWGVKEFNAAAKHAQTELEQAAYVTYKYAALAADPRCIPGLYTDVAKAAGRAAVAVAHPTYSGYYAHA